jgi:putative membrane protein
MKQKFIDTLLLAFRGFCMGAADIVPGVSGGTMAYILGIYERLIVILDDSRQAAQNFLQTGRMQYLLAPDWHFILSLLAGILGALIFFTRVIPLPELLKTYPSHVYALFFGLILASIVLLVLEVRFQVWKDLLWGLVGAGAGLVIVMLIPLNTPDTWWFIMLSGAIAISAMLLPGISGSFLLLILGKYATLLVALRDGDLAVIAPFVVGLVAGLMLFSKLLRWCMDHHRRRVLWFMNGLLLASLLKIWPFQYLHYEEIEGKQKLVGSELFIPAEFNSLSSEVALLMSAGIAGIFILHLVSRTKKSY